MAPHHPTHGAFSAVHRLEYGACNYWTWREGVAYAPLVEVTQQARNLGLHVSIPPIPACGTARCFRRAIFAQQAGASRLRQAIAMIHRDAATSGAKIVAP